MKKIITLVAVVVAVSCLARPVASLVGAKHTSHADVDIQEYSASDYIQEGLVAMWDAVENAGWGQHVDYSSVWLDLVDGFYLSTGGGNVGDFSNGYMDYQTSFFNGEGNPADPTGMRYYDKAIALRKIMNSGTWTIDVVHRPHIKGWSSWEIANQGVKIFALANSHNSIGLTADGKVQFYSGVLNGGTSVLSSPFIDGIIQSKTIVCDAHNLIVKIFVNAQEDTYGALNPSTAWTGSSQSPLVHNGTCIGFGVFGNSNSWNSNQTSCSDIYSLRIYERVLDNDEIRYNYELDLRRFGNDN